MSLMLGSGSNEHDPDPSHHEYPSCDSIGTRFMVDETTHPPEILVGRGQIEMTPGTAEHEFELLNCR
jgi:hypothetical protein